MVLKFKSIDEGIKCLCNNVNLHHITIYKKISACLKGNKESFNDIVWQYSTPNNLPGEIWEDIPKEIIGGEENYQVSTHGRIKLFNGRITFGHKNYNGYMFININNKTFQVHRLVAFALIYNDDPENKTVVNHIDESKTNNKLENLQVKLKLHKGWCTPSQNTQHSIDRKKQNTN